MNDERTIGQHEARLDNLEKSVDTIAKDVKTILEHVAADKGGWRAITALGTASGVVGAIIAEWFTRRG